ncbi:MAG TPA: fimbrillin family protein [Bacteroidales bacterium]|nr:fimbrillin family protein [Bacteroidales bacterium]
MKKVFLIVFLIIFGCTKEAPEKIPLPPDEVQVPIGFGAGIINTKAPIESVSGVPSTQIDGIQVLRVEAAKNSTPVWTATSSVAATASFFTTGNFVVTPAQYYPGNKNTYAHFTAYYPGVNENSVATTLSNGVATFTITGQEDIISAPSASAQGSQNPIPVALTFSHKLSQLQIYIKAANDGAIAAWGNITAVKASSPTVLTLNVTSQALAQHSTPVVSDLSTGESPQALTTSSASFGTILVFPGTLTLKVTSANVPEQTVTISGLSSTTAGHAHRIDLTFTATAINFSATLTDWVNGATGSGTVE